MAGEHDVTQALIMEDVEHIGEMRRQIDRRTCQMRALALPGQSRRENKMAEGAKPLGHLEIAPAARPRAVDEDERRHGRYATFSARWRNMARFASSSNSVLKACLCL